jgi:histidyl-tRNA synthetase
LGLFEQVQVQNTQVLVANFGGAEEGAAMQAVQTLRRAGIRTEMYPDAAKMKKQFKYADDKNIGHVLIIGEAEHQQGLVQLKYMGTGEQVTCTIEEAIARL